MLRKPSSPRKRRLQPSNLLGPAGNTAGGADSFSIKTEVKLLNDATLFLEKGIKVSGFTKVKSTYRNLDAFYHRGLGIIVKRPALILEPSIPSHLIVPTVKLRNGWVVQPIVKKTRLKEAVRRLERKLKSYREQGMTPDLHVGNVGWYKGEPLMFDW